MHGELGIIHKSIIPRYRTVSVRSGDSSSLMHGTTIACLRSMTRMATRKIVYGFILGAMMVAPCRLPTSVAAAVEIAPGAVSSTDEVVLKELVNAFDRAEAAVQQASLETLMPFYDKGYNYHGLKRADVQRVWEEVFTHYRAISSRHLFTNIIVSHANGVMKAHVTCTGGLYGAEMESGKPITIDSWVNEIHYLMREDGVWRFHGNAGGPVGAGPAGSAPHHPLF